MSTSASQPIPDLSRSYGAAMIGLLFTTFLSGIMTLQAHLYFQRARHDKPALKIMVAIVWFIDIAHLCAISHFVYHFVISNWGNMSIIGQSIWSLGLEEMLNTWITFIVQMFFIHRAKVLGHHRWYTLSPLYLLASMQLGFGTGGGIKSMLPQTVGHLASTRWRASIWLISGAVNDILIALILCYHLQRQRTVISQRLIDQLLAYTINTGLLTSILAFIDIACFIVMPGNYIHLAFNFTLGRIYTNSLLASLNMREYMRRANNTNTIALSTGSLGTSTHETGSTGITFPGSRAKVSFKPMSQRGDDLESGIDEPESYPGKHGDVHVSVKTSPAY